MHPNYHACCPVGDPILHGRGIGGLAPHFPRPRRARSPLIDRRADSDSQSDPAFSLSGLVRARRRSGDRAAAVTDLRKAVAILEGLTTLLFEVRYDLARNHALLAGLATEDGSGLSPADGLAEADRAAAMLKRSVAEG
jgi:hypothetical protein